MIGEAPGGREFGMGRGWGGNEEREVSLRATWDQGGRDRTTQEEGFQVSRRVQEKRELARGIGKGKPAKGITRNCAIT